MQTGELFTYFWHEEDEDEESRIRIYGIDASSESVLLRVEDFTPYAYLELPEETTAGTHVSWTQLYAQRVLAAVAERTRMRPAKSHFLHKRKLYFHSRDSRGREKTFPFLLVAFRGTGARKNYSYRVHGKQFMVPGLGLICLRLHETDASATLQLCCHRRLPSAGWVKFRGRQVEATEARSRCNREYIVSWRSLATCDDSTVPVPLVLSMDIEANSTNPSRMPQSKVPGDKTFQIGCVLFGSSRERKILLT